MLCGMIPFYSEFNLSERCVIIVEEPMPILDVTFHSVPAALRVGQMVQTMIEVSNKGHSALTNLVIKSSHPSVFQFGEPDRPLASSCTFEFLNNS